MNKKNEESLEKAIELIRKGWGMIGDVHDAMEKSMESKSEKFKQSDDGENMGYNVEDLSSAIEQIDSAIDHINDAINR